ncbi:MAG: hypothetical protein SF172_15420 [Burkholderiales bacterium]|nr:hypothetical protein [Burkholderiales bacterium]
MNSPFPHSAQTGKPGQPDEEDWLDQMLREDARKHVDDAGFTASVMTKLPSAKPARMRWQRLLPALLAGVAAWVAIGVLPGGDVFLDGAADLLAADLTSPRVVALLGTLVVFFGVVGAAVSTER